MNDYTKTVQQSGILELLRNALPEEQRKVFDEYAKNRIEHWEHIYDDMNNVLNTPVEQGESDVEKSEGQHRHDEKPTSGG